MIVMKFGGTSVESADAITRVASIVRGRLADKPVVIVSAMARVTDTLVAMGQAAIHGQREQALELSRGLRERHLAATSELLSPGDASHLHHEICSDFNSLDELLRGIAAIGELTLRTTDAVLAFGEHISSRLAAAAFRKQGVNALRVDSRKVILTDNSHGRAVPQWDDTNFQLREHLGPLLEKDVVPVLGGYMGATREGATTTLGRGGSDFTAAIVGAGLNSERIEIWTDVDGMKTTDPNLCPDARRIRQISFEEAAELAYFGAKVLHPATLLPAVQKNIPVLILNSRNPANPGTTITARAPKCRNPFKAIAAKKRVTIVDVVATRMLGAHGFLAAIFEVFARHRCPVDMVSTSEVSVSLTVDSNEAIPAIAADLQKLADVSYEGRKAIVCLVGENIRGAKGIAAKVFGAIPDIDVRMISQGASEINISFVINEDDVPQAVKQLHAKFFADPDPGVFA